MEHPLFPTVQPTAMALLRGDPSHPNLMGQVFFSPYGRGTLILARVLGLPAPGFMGLHIHQNGDCSTGGDIPFAAAGAHYDLHGVSHPWHGGDLPPLLSSAEGTAFLAVYTDRFRPEQVIGRSVIVHNSVDDFSSQPAGNSGQRIACGVIQAI